MQGYYSHTLAGSVQRLALRKEKYMSNTEGGMTMEELVTRLSELERATVHMSEELALLREARMTGNGQDQVNTRATPLMASAKPKKGRTHKSRRGLLKNGLGVAIASLGAAAAFEISGGNALANGIESSTTFNNNGGSSPAVTANSTSPSSSKVNAIKATSTGYTGIAGYTNQNSNSASGVSGQGPYIGVSGQVNGANMLPNVKVGVFGTAGNPTSPYVGGIGVLGSSDTYYGVSGTSTGGGSTTDSAGVVGTTTSTSYADAGVKGVGSNGIVGLANNAIKDGISSGGNGVYGSGSNGNGSAPLYGTGVYGVTDGGNGVVGAAFLGGTGVFGSGSGGSGYGYGMEAIGDYFGLYAWSDSRTAIYAHGGANAGIFDGNVTVNGYLSKSSGSFKIDHPLDPANKYLFHSFVESPDMKNVYDGVVTLDAQGEAVVTLPNWFDALNTDFRYQLSAVGASAPNLHIASEISNQSFKIAGGTAGLKVCWQVTGNRQDPWAKAHPIPVEQDKTSSEKGHYLHPELYGHASDPNILEDSYADAKQWHALHSKRPKK